MKATSTVPRALGDSNNTPADKTVMMRRAADWQARQPWTNQEHDTATEAADALSLKLHLAAQK